MGKSKFRSGTVSSAAASNGSGRRGKTANGNGRPAPVYRPPGAARCLCRGAAGQARATAAGQFSCADMKLSAAQFFGREDEEALTTGRRRRHHRLRGRHNRRHRRRPLRHRSPCRRHHQPTCSCSGSDGTLTVGSAEVAWASKACTCLAKGSHIRGEAEDKGSLNKWVNINVENGLLEA